MSKAKRTIDTRVTINLTDLTQPPDTPRSPEAHAMALV